jgi:glucose/arabinose dehydrogenase
MRLIILIFVFISFSCTHPHKVNQKDTVSVPNKGDTEKELRSGRADVFVVKPATLEFSQDKLQQLKLPPGFKINVFAKDFDGPRSILVAANGDVYIAERNAGKVVLLRDRDGDGVADFRRDAIAGVGKELRGVHGLAMKGSKMYMVTDRQLYYSEVRDDGSLGPKRKIFDDLPDGGQHPNRTMHFGPDSHLYLSIGSTCNSCPEPNLEAATMLQVSKDERSRRVWARGLRNTIGFAWHPVTKQMWGMDHNTDYLGNDIPPEELNLLTEGKNYGWPECWGKQNVDWLYHSEPRQGDSRIKFCQSTEPSVLDYQAHAAPMMMLFYTGASFPTEFRHDAFVAMRGSWNRNPPYGYKIVRIKYNQAGQPIKFEDFVSGWLAPDKKSRFGRPTGLAQAKDGSLLLSDDENGIIYRISYTGE